MAEVETASLPSDSSLFCGRASMNSDLSASLLKRKTPSQLRGEHIKRKIAAELVNESFPFEKTNVVNSGTKKADGFRNTRYIDKRLDEVYPAKKPTIRLGLPRGKSNLKESETNEGMGGLMTSFSKPLKSHRDHKSLNEGVPNATFDVSGHGNADKENQSRFLSVNEVSRGTDRFSQQVTVDMDKALKGVATRETSGSCSPSSSAGNSADAKSVSSRKLYSELRVPGRKVPLDCTLKTSMRIVSSSPVDWLHRLLMSGTYNGMTPFSFLFPQSGKQSVSPASDSSATAHPCSLTSWIYPQSSLPASVISVLSSSAGGVEMDFLTKRQLAWEDSFRTVYYMLRKNRCNIFYVCSSQFVVMFTAVDSFGKGKRICNAYISRSTRGLRSLLREHDICYSMPLCCSEVEQISREDLVELSEIEKHNLGQAKCSGSMLDVDNSPQSLLAFYGNDSVHNLYDFLLNYRSLLTMLSSMDVPVICAPVPFLNAALSSPEVRCKEIRRADASQSKALLTKEGGSSVCYSIEIRDAFLPPWIVCTICSAMGSEQSSFEATFMTEPNSMGLNTALRSVGQIPNNDETTGDSQEADCMFGISSVAAVSDLHSACLKSLKYSDGSYEASLSPI